jgi:hypothetical protein
VVERAVAALPPGVEEILVRGDSALYEHELLRWLDERRIGFAVSADLSARLAAAIRALPEAAWMRLNALLYNLLSALKQIALPPELRTARPKRLRFLLLNQVGRVIRHARSTLLRLTNELAQRLWDRARVVVHSRRLAPAPS